MLQSELVERELPLIDCVISTKRPVQTTWSEKVRPRKIPTKLPSGRGVALIYGPVSDVICIDLDVHNGIDGIAAYTQRYGESDTAQVQTPSGGIHLIYTHDPEITSLRRGNLPPGIDVRAGGRGYALIPPSPGYTWITPPDTVIQPLPAQLKQDLLAPAPLPVIEKTNTTSSPTDSREDRYAQAALTRELDTLSNTPPGQRNEQLNRSAHALGQLIASGILNHDTVLSQLTATALAIGLDKREVELTIKSGLKAGQTKPRNLPPPPTMPSMNLSITVPSTDKPVTSADRTTKGSTKADEAAVIITHMIEAEDIKYNLVLEQYEVAGEPMDDRLEHSLWHRYANNFTYDLFDKLLTSNLTPAYDPITHWLQRLPKAEDGTIELLADHLSAAGGVDTRQALRWWMLGAVGAAYGICTPQGVLTLIGDQGVGKSSWLRALCPPELRNYYSETPLDPRNKDSHLQLTDCWIINLEELDMLRSARELAELKPLITLARTTVRRSYARRQTSRPRRASLVASTNSQLVLRDATGNRRWWCIHTKAIDIPPRELVELAWSEAHRLVTQEQHDTIPPGHWIGEVADVATEFTLPETEMELIEKYIQPQSISELGEWLSLTDIIEKLSALNPNTTRFISRERLGRSLTTYGLERKHTKFGSKYQIKWKGEGI